MTWIEVARLSDVPAGQVREVVAGEHIVALANVEGEIFAVDGICAHQGGPVGKGQLTGCLVTCPWHGWQYDVRSGRQPLHASVKWATFQVRVERDTILLHIDSSSTPS